MRADKILPCLLGAFAFLLCLTGCENPAKPAPVAEVSEVPYGVPAPVLIWSNGAPKAEGTSEEDMPAIYPYLPDPVNNTGCAVVICPGGAFTHRAMDYEGVTVAQWFRARGIAAFILRYRLTPIYTRADAVADARRALQFLRAHATEYKISPVRLGMIGFSAGSELAAKLALNPLSPETNSPDPIEQQRGNMDFLVLGYGSASGPVSRETTPPTFFFGTAEDSSHATGMLDLYWDMYNEGVPAEIHIFPNGEHGVGMAYGDPVLGEWPVLLYNWMRARNLLTVEPEAVVHGHVRLDGAPLAHGSITFIPIDNPGAAPRTAYIMNTRTDTADFKLDGETKLVRGRYRVEVRQDAARWMSNDRDPGNKPGVPLEDRSQQMRSAGWGAPTIDDVRLYRKQHPADAKELTVDIAPGDNTLQIEIFTK